MNYESQLNSIHWKHKRDNILARDNAKCTQCSNESYIDTCLSSNAIRLSAGNNRCLYEIQNKSKLVCLPKSHNISSNEIIVYYKEPDINEQKEYKYIDVRAVRTCTQNDNLYSLIKGKDKDKIGEVELNALKLIFGDPENIIRDLHPTPHGDYEWLYIKDIHIHHKYYQKGKMAWEYPNDALITLCWSCHEELHQNKDIEVKDESGNIIGFYKVCSRCHGAGWFPQYKHVENGICFKCEGSKFEDSCKI